MPSLGEFIGKQRRETDQIKRGGLPEQLNYLLFFDTSPQIRDVNFELQTRNIAGTGLIWDHETLGIWDEYNWAAAAASFSFILNSPVGGVLGQNKLGENASVFRTFASSSTDQQLTLAGRTNMAEWLALASGNNYPIAVAVGSGSTAYDISQTDMVNELDWGRPSVTHNLTDKMVEFGGIWKSTVSGSAQEFGLFDNATSGSGDMFTRRVLTTLTPKTNQEEWRFRVWISGSNAVPLTNLGINSIRDFLASGNSVTNPQFMSWASGNTLPAVTDTAMETIHATNPLETGTVIDQTAQMTGILGQPEASGLTINRIGLWTASASGDLILHQSIQPLEKTTSTQWETRGDVNMV